MKARSVASAVIVALMLVGTSACTYMTPQTTLKHYEPSDGVGTNVGDIQVRNVILISADGHTGNLLINLANTDNAGVKVNLQYLNADNAKVNQSVFVNGGSVKSLGAEGKKQLILTGLDAKPGSLFPLYVQYDNVGGQQIMVPVLDGSEPAYTKLVPSTEK